MKRQIGYAMVYVPIIALVVGCTIVQISTWGIEDWLTLGLFILVLGYFATIMWLINSNDK